MMLQDLLPLMREQESDGHVSNNAAALVTGPRLLTSPVTDVASNSSTDIHAILEKVKKVWSYHAIFHSNVKLFSDH